MSGRVSFNGKSYEISNGFFKELEFFEGSRGFFSLSDGILTYDRESLEVSASDFEINIIFNAFDITSPTLENGSYTIGTSTLGPNAGSLNVIISEIDATFFASEGTIIISGSENNYDITFMDIQFIGQDFNLTGTISGTFSTE